MPKGKYRSTRETAMFQLLTSFAVVKRGIVSDLESRIDTLTLLFSKENDQKQLINNTNMSIHFKLGIPEIKGQTQNRMRESYTKKKVRVRKYSC